jgi:DNA-binding response OmpR family regulator
MHDVEKTTANAAVSPRRDRPLVLVVNDTQEILELFREILEEEGFAVELAAYGIDEVSKVEEISPDLVILDFMIDGEAQGWQLLQKLRMARATQELPVIVCTGAIRLAQDLQGQLTAKNVGLVLKPFDIDDLVREVNHVMGRDTAAAQRGD